MGNKYFKDFQLLPPQHSPYYSLQTSQSLMSNDSACSAAPPEVTSGSGIAAAEKNSSLWPLPNFSGLLTAALASRKTAFDHQHYHPLMMKAAAGVGLSPNPILALIANRSSQLFGFLRPVNPAPVSTPPPGFLDLSTILMLQNNILTMLNNNTNRQVGIL